MAGKAARPGRPRVAKRDGWGKEAVLAGLREGKAIMDVCAEFSLDSAPRTLYKEVADWRKSDPSFNEQYNALLDERFPGRYKGGRPKLEHKDPFLADWRVRYCEDLFETGNRYTAAENSPFEYSYIAQLLDPTKAQYDKDFAEMVHLVELRTVAEMEGGFISAYRSATSPRDKAWIAQKYLSVRAPERWAPQSKVQHTGTVKHEHQHNVLVSREDRLKALADDQQKFFTTSTPLALESGPEVVEGEVVHSEPSEA